MSFASDTKLTDRRTAAAGAVVVDQEQEQATTKLLKRTIAEEVVKNKEIDGDAIQTQADRRQTRRRFRPGRAMKEKKTGQESSRKQGEEQEQEQGVELKEEKKGRRSLFGIGPRRSTQADVPSEGIGRRKQKKQDSGTGSSTAGGIRRRNRTS